jgi:hypothetical protein
MLAIEMRGGREGDKELGPIGVLSGIGHREEAWGGMWEPDTLIIEFVTVYGLPASAILVGDVTSLHHEALDDSVEDVALVMKSLTLLTCADHAEIFSSLRDLLGEQFEDDSASNWLVTSDFNVKVDLRVVDLEFRESICLLLLDWYSLLIVQAL